MEEEHRETCWYSLLLVASVNDAFCPFQPLLSICIGVERRGGKRDVGSWTDSFFTHVRQVSSYCLGHKKTNVHKRGCFRSTAPNGLCLATQKAPVQCFTFLVAYVCLHKHAQTQTCEQNWNINLFFFWNEWHGGPLCGLLYGWPIIPRCDGRASGLSREGGGETCPAQIKTLFNRCIERQGCVRTRWKVGHSTKS